MPVVTGRTKSATSISTSGISCTSPRVMRLKEISMLPARATMASPTVTLVRNGPLNTACRTLIEESSGCEDDQAALQGAENRSCLAQVMRSGTVGLVGVFEIYELYLPVLNADGLGGQMLVEVVPRSPLLVDLAYASQGGHHLGGLPLVRALLRHLTPYVATSHQRRMSSRRTGGEGPRFRLSCEPGPPELSPGRLE